MAAIDAQSAKCHSAPEITPLPILSHTGYLSNELIKQEPQPLTKL
jgi:hypothetical protein